MPNRDLVVIGASAGGVEALQQLCAGLPPDLKAAVLVVLHTSMNSGGLLPQILNRAGRLHASSPDDFGRIERGKIYVAPPDFHMIVEDGHLRLVRGPRENRHRPAIDPTFRSAAMSYGPRVIGIVLTGSLDDGTSGLMVIRAHGGEAIVQDPETALFPSMPESALKQVKDATVAQLAAIPALIVELVSQQVNAPEQPTADPETAREIRMAELKMPEVENEFRTGKPSGFGCPECGGVLWEIDQAGLLRFRCRVGHAYTASHLRAEQRFAVESALWAALRALEENASLYERIAERARSANRDLSQKLYEERATTAQANSRTLREFLMNFNSAEADVDAVAEPAEAPRR